MKRLPRVECRLPTKYYEAFKHVAEDKGTSVNKIVKLVLEAKYKEIKPIKLSVASRAVIISKLTKILTEISNLYDPINAESSNLNQAMHTINGLRLGGVPLSTNNIVVSMFGALKPDKTRKPLLKLDKEVTKLWKVFEQSEVSSPK